MVDLSVGIGPGIQVTPNLNLVALGLSRFAGDLRSLREPLEREVEPGGVVHNRIRANFATETAALAFSWPGLKQWTQEDRRAQGYGATGPILQRTGTLRREALQKKIWTFRGQQGIAFVRQDAFRQAPYADAMNDGRWMMWHGGRLPARPFLVINFSDIDKIAGNIEDWVRDRANANLPRIGVAAGLLSGLESRRAERVSDWIG